MPRRQRASQDRPAQLFVELMRKGFVASRMQIEIDRTG